MAYAKHHSRKLLMQDKTTGIFHETPKIWKLHVWSDKDDWISSMQREMDAMEETIVGRNLTNWHILLPLHIYV